MEGEKGPRPWDGDGLRIASDEGRDASSRSATLDPMPEYLDATLALLMGQMALHLQDGVSKPDAIFIETIADQGSMPTLDRARRALGTPGRRTVRQQHGPRKAMSLFRTVCQPGLVCWHPGALPRSACRE